MWLAIIVLIIFSKSAKTITSKKELQKSDYYGEYIIDKSFFPGKQSNWQYDHFRFEIKQDDKLYFYESEKDKVVKTYIGTISTVRPWNSERLIINMEKPTIHIMKSNPTIYRNTWDFYLVFYSEKFNNMYFKKGIWKPLNKQNK